MNEDANRAFSPEEQPSSRLYNVFCANPTGHDISKERALIWTMVKTDKFRGVGIHSSSTIIPAGLRLIITNDAALPFVKTYLPNGWIVEEHIPVPPVPSGPA